MPKKSDHFVLICSTCEGPVDEETARDVLGSCLPSGFVVRSVACMAGCDRPMTVGLQAAGKAQYLFGDIGSLGDLNAISVFAGQYQQSADGWTKATERPRLLLTKTLSRMPGLLSEVSK